MVRMQYQKKAIERDDMHKRGKGNMVEADPGRNGGMRDERY